VAVKEATDPLYNPGGEPLELESVEQAGIVDSIKGSFDIELQEAHHSPVAPGCMCSIDNKFDSEVCRTFRAVTHLCFREESLGLCHSCDVLADHCLNNLSHGVKE
jgi:hypothetical protein